MNNDKFDAVVCNRDADMNRESDHPTFLDPCTQCTEICRRSYSNPLGVPTICVQCAFEIAEKNGKPLVETSSVNRATVDELMNVYGIDIKEKFPWVKIVD